MNNLILLEKLCKEYPDAYVSVNEKDKIEHIPIRTEMFDFSYIRMINNNYLSQKFKIDEYNNLPIVLTLHDEEIKTFDELYQLLMFGKNIISMFRT